MQHNIYAYTEFKYIAYPGFISINQQYDKSVTITIRSPEAGAKSIGTITIPLDQLESLSNSITNFINDINYQNALTEINK